MPRAKKEILIFGTKYSMENFGDSTPIRQNFLPPIFSAIRYYQQKITLNMVGIIINAF